MKSRSTAAMRIAKNGYIVTSVIMCIIGILFIILPENSSVWLARFCGAVLIVSGIVRIIGYFSRDLYRLAFQYDLEFGLIMIITGLAAILQSLGFIKLVSVIFGLAILADGLFKIRIAKDSKDFGIGRWPLILISAIITCIMGGVMIFIPAQGGLLLTVWLGISLLCEGILNLIVAIVTIKIIKDQKPDIIDGEYTEVFEREAHN